MGNRQNCAKFQENLFRSNEIISIFCPPLFRKRPLYNFNLHIGYAVSFTCLNKQANEKFHLSSSSD